MLVPSCRRPWHRQDQRASMPLGRGATTPLRTAARSSASSGSGISRLRPSSSLTNQCLTEYVSLVSSAGRAGGSGRAGPAGRGGGGDTSITANSAAATAARRARGSLRRGCPRDARSTLGQRPRRRLARVAAAGCSSRARDARRDRSLSAVTTVTGRRAAAEAEHKIPFHTAQPRSPGLVRVYGHAGPSLRDGKRATPRASKVAFAQNAKGCLVRCPRVAHDSALHRGRPRTQQYFSRRHPFGAFAAASRARDAADQRAADAAPFSQPAGGAAKRTPSGGPPVADGVARRDAALLRR